LTGNETTTLVKITALTALTLLFLSYSRTATLSFVIAFVLIYIIGMIRSMEDRQRVQRITAVVIALLLFVVVTNYVGKGAILGRLTHFLIKYNTPNSAATPSPLSALTGARADKAVIAWRTFHTAPYAGVGFGMPMGNEPIVTVYDPLLGIPLTAPVEASVMYAALPAQIGILGMFPFLLFVGMFFIPIIFKSRLYDIALVLCALTFNMGEYLFFATGGLGMYLWLIWAFAYRSYYDNMTGRA